MSDTQQGPDWWLASDGKWYPPTSVPEPPAPPSPPRPASTPATPSDGGSDRKERDGWWLATNGRWYPPDGTAPNGQINPFTKKTSAFKAWAWVLGGVFVVWLLYAMSNNDASPPPTTRTPSTLSDASITALSLDITWSRMSASDRMDLCKGVEVFGLSTAADLMRSEAQSLDKDEVMAFLSSKC